MQTRDRRFEALTSQIEYLKRRLPEFRPQPVPADVASAGEMLRALEETVVQLEAAQEALQRQNEELQATRELAEHQASRYRNLFRNAPDAYLCTDAGGFIREANGAACTLFNVQEDQLVGKPMAALLEPHYRRGFFRLLHAAASGEFGSYWDCVFKRRDGAVVHISLSAVTASSSEPHGTALSWLVRDETHRTAMDLQIRQALQDLEVLTDITRVAVSTLDLNVLMKQTLPLTVRGVGADAGEIWLLDTAQEEIFLAAQVGTPLETVSPHTRLKVGESIPGRAVAEMRLVLVEDLRQDEAFIRRQAIEAGFTGMVAFPLVVQNMLIGALCLAVRERPIPLERWSQLMPRIGYALATAMHNAQSYERIVELAAEEVLFSQEATREREQLQRLVDITPVGVMVVEAATRNIVLINWEMLRIIGKLYHAGEWLVDPPRVKFYRSPSGEQYEIGDTPLRRALVHGETIRAEEMWIETPEGQRTLTLTGAIPVRAADGSVQRAIVTTMDMTPVESLERQRAEFLGIVSHEMRTPLAAIKGSVATALENFESFSAQEAKETFHIINEQADRLRDLVNNLLDMTRIETGSLTVRREPVDFSALLREALRSFYQDHGQTEVLLHVPDDLPLVSADSARIMQVLTNLLKNAWEHSPALEPVAVNVQHNGDFLLVQVMDKGDGFSKDRLPQLFRKFSRIHEGESRGIAGTGLGLAICKGIVEAHGGRIWADSEGPGKGASFVFTLPVAAAHPLQQEAPRQPSPLSGGASTPPASHARQGARILVVDDDYAILHYMRRTLRQEGYDVQVTSDPRQVVDVVASQKPDLVLLDLRLPVMSGLEVLHQIREFSNVPVVFLTAVANEEEVVHALRAGADDYIIKPFSNSELLARMEAIFRRRSEQSPEEPRLPYVAGDLQIDFYRRKVIVVGNEVKLTATEYKLLHLLATNSGRVLTHEQILQRVWGSEYSSETELVRAMVKNLRRKLGDDARSSRYVFTEPRVGYSMPRPTLRAHWSAGMA